MKRQNNVIFQPKLDLKKAFDDVSVISEQVPRRTPKGAWDWWQMDRESDL